MYVIEIISAVIAATATLVGGLWFVVRKAAKLSVDRFRLEQAEGKLAGLPCKEHDTAIDRCNSNIERLAKMLAENNSMLVELSKWAMHMDESMIDKLARKASPLQMTDTGRTLFTKSGADKALAQMADGLIGTIEQAAPRTEYDVEQKALEVLLRNTGNEALDPVKHFVYYSPDTIAAEDGSAPVRFDFYAIIKLMSIRLRDLYMEKHPIGMPSAAN